uniref:Nidogen 2a (osteonidogen) n=1 Tax=Kryptolebias marmoratus TaxID=37003 RepID=A0A3Q2ZBW7_KRYMA
ASVIMLILLMYQFNKYQPERPKTSCERHKERAEATISGGYPIAGAYVPQCDADGHYIPLQCYDSTGHCWCVDRNGQERSGTRTPPGTPPKDCDKSGITSYQL